MSGLWHNGGFLGVGSHRKVGTWEGTCKTGKGQLVHESRTFGASNVQYSWNANQTRSSQNGNSKTALDGVVSNNDASGGRGVKFRHPSLIQGAHFQSKSEVLHCFTPNTQ